MGKDKCKLGFYYGIHQFRTNISRTILSRSRWQSIKHCPLKTALTYIWGIYCLFTVEPILVCVWTGDYLPAGRHKVSYQLSGVAMVTRWYEVQTCKLKFKIRCPWWFLHGSNFSFWFEFKLKQEKNTKNCRTSTGTFSVKDDVEVVCRIVQLSLHSSWSSCNWK